MSRLRWLLVLLALGTAWGAERPNILLMVSDDQGWWDVGVNGNADIATPTLDRLAGEGVNLTRFYAAPVCSPTRAGLMTGRYALRVGVYNTRFGGDSLRLSETTLAEVLRRAGYRTGVFGKWHLGGYAPYRPEQRGFDTALTFTHGHHERYNYPELMLDGRPVASRGHITDILADSAAAFIEQSGEQPFFAYVPFNVPHSPHYVDDSYIEPYLAKGLELREARIYGMITHMDEAIERLLGAVDRAGKRDETLVIFLGDNGGVSRHTRLWLRGGKASPFEGGLRVPAFFRWPGKIPAGKASDAMTSHLDILPTLCAILGVEPPAQLDGKSLWPLLEEGEGESPHERLFHVWDRHRPTTKRGWSVTEPRWKLTYEGLYDLEADRGEKHDVSGEHPEVAKRLHKAFVSWLAEVTKDLDFEPVPIPVTGAEPVLIEASWARVNGTHTTWASPGTKQSAGPDPLGDPKQKASVNYTFAGYDWDTIDGWSKPGEAVLWRLDVADAGEYEVVAAYGCDPADAGGTLRLSFGAAKLDAVIEATPERHVFETRPLGRLRLEAGPVELKAEVVSAPGKELMTLNRIWLRRP
ncbi:MAG: arylsulfatase [Bryobacterales bacterium]|nr:arylsulfatase [Bryobacterales bacterium]